MTTSQVLSILIEVIGLAFIAVCIVALIAELKDE